MVGHCRRTLGGTCDHARCGARLRERRDGKAMVERQLARQSGIEVRYKTLDLGLWPSPTAELHQVTFRMSPDVDGRVERVLVRFALLPLLTGDMQVSLARLEQPNVVVRIRASGDARIPEEVVATYRHAVDSMVASLASRGSRVPFEVRDGAVDLRAPGWPDLTLDGVTVNGEAPPRRSTRRSRRTPICGATHVHMRGSRRAPARRTSNCRSTVWKRRPSWSALSQHRRCKSFQQHPL